MNATAPRTAEDVRAISRLLYGGELDGMRGVLHVVAIGGERRVIKIGAHAPQSAWDWQVLQLARARVDAIVITGQVVRDEPTLRYADAPAFAAYRRSIGTAERPWLLVLTHGDVPASHPVWSSAARPVVFTDGRPRGLPAHVEIVGTEAPSIEAALTHLMHDRGARGVSLEAGPRAVLPLYARDAVDELMLSVFEGPLLPPAIGGAFIDPAIRLARASSHAIDEPSGRWRFERWLRQ